MIWDANTDRQLATLTGHKDWVSSAEISTHAMQAVTASRDGIALVWQHYGAAEWRIEARLEPDGFCKPVRDVSSARRDL